MFHILGILFFICLAILIAVLVVIAKIVGTVFGFGRKVKRSFTSSEPTDEGKEEKGDRQITRRKIFGDDEGEYVEFEEVKD